MKKSGDYPIPLNVNGDQLHYPDDYGRLGKVETWAPNDPFEDELTYEGFARGRSAAYLLFRRSDGRKVTMFMAEFNDVVPLMTLGKIDGVFRFTKRGQNYGCIRVGEPTRYAPTDKGREMVKEGK